MLQQRTHPQRALAGPGVRHREPALEQAEGGAPAGAVVQVHLGVDAVAGVEGVVGLPAALEDVLVDAGVLGVFPALDAAAVDVRAEAELGVAGGADA